MPSALGWTSLDLSDEKSTLVQVMAWCRQATSQFLNQCWPRFLPPYSVTRPQWVNTGFDESSDHLQLMWLVDTIWCHRSGSTLAQVMACFLTAPSHFLNQYWLIVSKVLWHSTGQFHRKGSRYLYGFENYQFKITAVSPGEQWVDISQFGTLYFLWAAGTFWMHNLYVDMLTPWYKQYDMTNGFPHQSVVMYSFDLFRILLGWANCWTNSQAAIAVRCFDLTSL